MTEPLIDDLDFTAIDPREPIEARALNIDSDKVSLGCDAGLPDVPQFTPGAPGLVQITASSVAPLLASAPEAVPAGALADRPATPRVPRRLPDVRPLDPGTSSLDGLGGLVANGNDELVLHTRHAASVFIDPQSTNRSKGDGCPDGQRFTFAARLIWHYTRQDNPYADWCLVRIDQRMNETRRSIDAATMRANEVIDALLREGLTVGIVASQTPKRFEIVPGCPYTYATASLVSEFDHYVRLVKTLVRKDRVSDAEGAQAIRSLIRRMRALFALPLPWARRLRDERLRGLTRTDFLPEAGLRAQARVEVASELFGALPRDVFTGAAEPRHTRRPRGAAQANRPRLVDASEGWITSDPRSTGTDP